MDRGKFIGACDWIAAAALTALALSVVALHRALPVGPFVGAVPGNFGPTVLGLSLAGWERVETRSVVIAGIALLPNVFFLRRASTGGSRLRSGAGLVAAAILFLNLANGSARKTPVAPAVSPDISGELFMKAWNLEKIERLAGVPQSFMRAKLGLPDSASAVAPLADLQRSYPFSADQAQRAIGEYNSTRRPIPSAPAGARKR